MMIPNWLEELIQCPKCAGKLNLFAANYVCESCLEDFEIQGEIPMLIPGRK